MEGIDIRTRVELRNETQRERATKGKLGRVALIGAFPSSKSKPFAAESFAQVVSHYGVKLNSSDVNWFGGVRAAKRIFMEGMKGYGGATSITCINVNDYKPNQTEDVNELYLETYTEEDEQYIDVTTGLPLSYGTINETDIAEGVDKYTPTNPGVAEGIKLTFDKLVRALHSISDEDMDILFIASDLWDIMDNKLTYPMCVLDKKKYATTTTKYLSAIETAITNTNDTNIKTSPLKKYVASELDENTEIRKTIIVNAEGKPVTYTTGTLKGTLKPAFVQLPEAGTSKTGKAYEEGDWVRIDSKIYKTNNPNEEINLGVTLGENERFADAVFRRDIIRDYYKDDNDIPEKSSKGATGAYPVAFEGKGGVYYLNYSKKVLFDYLIHEIEVDDENGNTLYGITPQGKYIRNIGDVYDYILDYIDNEFTNHRPVNYVGTVKTRKGVDPEGTNNLRADLGVGSKVIKIYSDIYTPIELPKDVSEEKENKKHEVTEKNPYADIVEWGALDIAKLFTRTTNELSTCGLFYQKGIINGEQVDEMEFAAHMCGWICSIPLDQDLTYQTIPGVTDINEEPYLNKNDAGALLNMAGIQVVKSKSRLDKTFYVNNSIQPTGWHTNHIRAVTYLLKRLQFESGLGMNNFANNVEMYRTLLDTTAKDVLEECEVIRSVDVGEVQVLSSYHIYVPIEIVLSGVITLINIGVSMALDETGTAGTYLKSTSGYSMSV